jgi:uncharacterized membrane protein YccC
VLARESSFTPDWNASIGGTDVATGVVVAVGTVAAAGATVGVIGVATERRWRHRTKRAHSARPMNTRRSMSGFLMGERRWSE